MSLLEYSLCTTPMNYRQMSKKQRYSNNELASIVVNKWCNHHRQDGDGERHVEEGSS